MQNPVSRTGLHSLVLIRHKSWSGHFIYPSFSAGLLKNFGEGESLIVELSNFMVSYQPSMTTESYF
jgi:hypothetical protein